MLAWDNQVRVGNIVETGNVANARIELRAETTKSVTCHSGVVGRGVGTTWEGDSWVHVSRLEHRNAFKGLPYILYVARP